jgi:hypothetical protein
LELNLLLKNKTFDCLIEIERTASGSKEKRPSLIVCKELPYKRNI